MQITSETVNMLLAAILSILTPVLAWYLRQAAEQGIAWMKAQVTAKQYQVAQAVLADLVRSAKAHGLNESLAATGDNLKAYVTQRAGEILAERGIVMDVNTIVDLLESAYIRMTYEAGQVARAELDTELTQK